MITIALWTDSQLLGIRCAKRAYGVDMIDDVLKGFSYHGKNGRLVVRVSQGEVSEDDRCDKCGEGFDMCNSYEVTV
jgi:hypothetical protein